MENWLTNSVFCTFKHFCVHEACSNASHTFFNAKEVVHQLKKDEGNSVTVSQEEDHICFWWIGPFHEESVTVCDSRYARASVGDVHWTPEEGAFYSSKLLLSAIYRQASPRHVPSPTHHALLRKAVLQCLIACTVLSFLLSSFFSCTGGPLWRWQYYQGEQQNHNMPIVNLTFNTFWSNIRKFSVHPESSKRELYRRG